MPTSGQGWESYMQWYMSEKNILETSMCHICFFLVSLRTSPQPLISFPVSIGCRWELRCDSPKGRSLQWNLVTLYWGLSGVSHPPFLLCFCVALKSTVHNPTDPHQPYVKILCFCLLSVKRPSSGSPLGTLVSRSLRFGPVHHWPAYYFHSFSESLSHWDDPSTQWAHFSGERQRRTEV